MNSFWSNPVLRSLLIGLVTVGGTVLVSRAIDDLEMHRLLGLPDTLFREQEVTIAHIGWAWVALSIVGSYVWHMRRLDRTTRMGKLADVLMWLQYVWLLLLTLRIWLFIPDGTASDQPFFG